jgi:superfamily II DNA or RNA helicase
VNQTARAYHELTNDNASLITSDNIKIRKFNIATLQTLNSISKTKDLQKLFSGVECIIADECHILGAGTYYKTLLSLPAPWRIGLSATPTNRTDSLDPLVVAATGGIIHEIKMIDMIEANNLAHPYIIFYNYSNEKYKYPHYKYKDVITLNKNRNIAILEMCLLAPKPCLLFYEYKEHGYLLNKNLKNLGVNSDIVHGGHNGFQRDEAIQDLVNGEIDILLTSRIFNKGVNIPELRSCINGAGWKAYIPTIQKLGRGTRKTEDKDKIIYFDFMDVENATSWSHSKERMQSYLSEDLNVEDFSTISDIKLYLNNICK